MPNLNKTMLMGNLTRDPELRYTPKGSAVAELSLAINRVWNNDRGEKQEETTFVDVTLWGKTAELAQKYLSKGNPVYIEGRLHLETWDDKQTGQKRSKLKVVGESLQFLSSKGDSAPRENSGADRSSTRPQQQRPPVTAPAAAEGDDQEEDDIPF